MIHALFLGLLYTRSASSADPCQVLECEPDAVCDSYKSLCQSTDGCVWEDDRKCNNYNDKMVFDKVGECCHMEKMEDTELFSTTMVQETTPSPTACYNNIDEIGKGAQFRFVTNCDKNEFVKVKMVSLIEYDDKGTQTKNKITSFASPNNWFWITNENDTYNGFEADINKYVSTLDIKRNYETYPFEFNLTTILFKEEAEVGNRTIVKDTLKWTTDIDGWPFFNENNTLELCINIMTNGGRYGRYAAPHDTNSSSSSSSSDSDSDSTSSSSDSSEEEEFLFNDFGFTLIDTAYCGDEEVEVETIKKQKKNFNQMDICFTFTACDGVIDYDPFVYYVGSGNQPRNASTTNIMEISLAVGISAFVIIAIAVVVALYCRKNKKLIQNTGLLNSTTNGGYDAVYEEV